MVTLVTSRPEETRAAPSDAMPAVGTATRASVMLMSVGGRFALVGGGILAIWTTIALALT